MQHKAKTNNETEHGQAPPLTRLNIRLKLELIIAQAGL